MKIQRQTTDFSQLTQRAARPANSRNSAFDAILARTANTRRQDSVTLTTTRPNSVTTPPVTRGDENSSSGRLNRTPLLPFGPPTTPPPSASTRTTPNPPPTNTPPTTTPPTTTPPTTPDRHPGMTALRNVLTQMGLQVSGLQMDYNEEQVGYPGGSYMNRLITVRTADGRYENFDAELTQRNPQITANEMMSTFKLTR